MKRGIIVCVVSALSMMLIGCGKRVEGDAGMCYARGADVSWLSEQEHDGVLFYTPAGERDECMHLLREEGMNAVRLRVWVEHETGWCNKDDMVAKARRADSLGLRVMVDFHYSDFFADPHQQNVPVSWLDWPNPSGEERHYGDTIYHLAQCIEQHTIEVLQALKDAGVEPTWVQVGNETRYGMLWPYGRTTDEQYEPWRDGEGWRDYALFTAYGYEACHAVFPDVYVINHIDNAYMDNVWFYETLAANGGKWDMIGLSHYPLMGEWNGGLSWQEMNSRALREIEALHEAFGCPILLSEIGTLECDVATSDSVMQDIRAKLDTLDYFGGIFYWEPQVYAGWRPQEYIPLGWGAYTMGAFETEGGCPNRALRTLLRP